MNTRSFSWFWGRLSAKHSQSRTAAKFTRRNLIGCSISSGTLPIAVIMPRNAKEEELLFAKMQERGMPVRGGPIAVMLQEHDEGRRRVKAVAEALPQAGSGNASALASVRSNLLAYVQLLRAHIDKEDNVLYPMADRLFTPEDQRELTEAFEKVEAEEIGEGVHEKYQPVRLRFKQRS